MLAGTLLSLMHMKRRCPQCDTGKNSSEFHPKLVRIGRFYRKSDSTSVQRFRCKKCLKGFSQATHHPCYRQNKRQKNEQIKRLLVSGVSQRQVARLLNISRKTVVRKFIFLGMRAIETLRKTNRRQPTCSVIEFDDMETFEHTKCKPLAISLAVEYKTRRILGFTVSEMSVKSSLAKIALKKYGPRKDRRSEGRKKLFGAIKSFVKVAATIKSDQNPHYIKDIRNFFPACEHRSYKGRRGCVVGQGELKSGAFDPLFSFNHTAAKIRGSVNRLFRRTWCTTKKAERLAYHLAIYSVYHNENLNLI